MHEKHEKLRQIGEAILSSARNELYLHMRFLDIALSGLGYEMNLDTPTVGTDGFSIQYNPRHLIELYQQDLVLLNRLYLHMLLHCLLRHPINREGREEDRWNLACDIAVESILDSIENKCIQLLRSELREDTYEDLKTQVPVATAEAIYRWLGQEKFDYASQYSLIREFRRDDHRFWPEEEKNNDQDRQQSQQEESEGEEQPRDRQNRQKRQELEAKWTKLSEKTQTNLETFFADHGDAAGDILFQLTIENRERYDYRQFLKRFVSLREEMKVDLDSFDYAYYALGLELYGSIPLIEPLEYRESRRIQDFAIVIDTSDSCSEGSIQAFLEQTRQVLSSEGMFFEDARLHIIQADAEVQMDTVIRNEKELEELCQNFTVRGFGGTDFRPAFAYVNRLKEEGSLSGLKGLLYFTDGFGSYPQRMPDYQVAFVFFKEDYMAPQVPDWAIKIVLGEAELEIQ